MKTFDEWWKTAAVQCGGEDAVVVADAAWNAGVSEVVAWLRARAEELKDKTLYHPDITLREIAAELAGKK